MIHTLGYGSYSESYSTWELINDSGETLAETDALTDEQPAEAIAWATGYLVERGLRLVGIWVEGDPSLEFQHYTIDARTD